MCIERQESARSHSPVWVALQEERIELILRNAYEVVPHNVCGVVPYSAYGAEVIIRIKYYMYA